MPSVADPVGYDAVLFDLDGTLVLSEPAWVAAKAVVAARHGAPWDAADAAWAENRATPEYSGRIASRSTDGVTVDTVAAEITAAVADHMTAHAPWREHAVAVLMALAERGTPMALVTMSYRPIVDALVATLPRNPFAVVVAGDAVTNSKPHPEPYLTALAGLGVAADRAVVVEDTATGRASAEAAGIRTVMVHPDGHDLDTESFWAALAG